MRSKLLIFCFIGALHTTNSWADDSFEEECSTSQLHQRLVQSNPQYRDTFSALSAGADAVRQDGEDNGFEVYTLPVVVHVIHRGSPIGTLENISDAQINSGINALNQDFRKQLGTNGDGDGVDTFIQFELAKRNPEGEPTSGILRVDGRVLPNFEEDGVADSSISVGAPDADVKSLSSWLGDDYINIFIVPEINGNDGLGGIKGYAYLGPTWDERDGIVLLSNVFGTEGEIKVGNLNRTTTHEMGHHLSLFHTFENTQSCDQVESNCSLAGDQICDTPVTAMNNSCSTNPCNAILENYMDYTPQSCRNMFTAGQRDRMRAMLHTGRASLLESLGATPLVDRDLTFSAVLEPVSSVCVSEVTAEVIIRNQGTETVSSFRLSGTLNGQSIQSVTFDEPVGPESTVTVSFPLGTAQVGNNTYALQVSVIGTDSDDFPGNNETEGSFVYTQSDTWTLALTTGFFANELDWSFIDEDGMTLFASPISGYPAGIIEYEYDFCVPYGCYDFIINDGRGEGMPYGGQFTLKDQSGEILAELHEEDNAFGPTITFDVCTTGSPPSEQPIDSDIADGGITSETNDPPDETVNMDGNDGGTPGVSPPDSGTAPESAGDNEQTAQLEKSDSSPSTSNAETMGCGCSQTLSFDSFSSLILALFLLRRRNPRDKKRKPN